MERICVFLSSKANLPENYVQAAIDVATWIGKSGRTLIYGGSRAGLMETLATTVRENGGRVIGVVPQAVVNRDLVSDASTTVFLHCRPARPQVDLHARERSLRGFARRHRNAR